MAEIASEAAAVTEMPVFGRIQSDNEAVDRVAVCP